MERSALLDSTQNFDSIVQIVTDGTSHFDSSYLAGQYAFDAAKDAGDGFEEGNLVFHLECLAEAGAEFDSSVALKIANEFASE